MALNEELVEAAAKAAQDASPFVNWKTLDPGERHQVKDKVRAAIAYYLEHRSDSDLAREAADTLVRTTRRYKGAVSAVPDEFLWHAFNLRYVADLFDTEDAAMAERDALVDEIATVTLRSSCGTQEVDLDGAGEPSASLHRNHARALLAKFDITRRGQS